MDEFEHYRVQELKEKRRRRKERIAAPGSFPCRTGVLAFNLRLVHLPVISSEGARAHSCTHDRRYGLIFTTSLGSVDYDGQPI